MRECKCRRGVWRVGRQLNLPPIFCRLSSWQAVGVYLGQLSRGLARA